MKQKKVGVAVLLLAALLLAAAPLFVRKGSQFGGSDDAGSEMVEELTGGSYEPWFTPVAERALGGELPGEVESLLFCVQTGIGVGIIAFVLGRFVERKKWLERAEPAGAGAAADTSETEKGGKGKQTVQEVS